MDMKNIVREKPMYNKFMATDMEDTNQGTPFQRDSCVFPLFGNIGSALMATLNIIGLNVGLLVPFWITLNVPNSLYASQIRTLCHGNQMDVDRLSSELVKFAPCFSPSSSEIIGSSNQKSKRNRNMKSKKNNSPTYASHVGYLDLEPSSASHFG
jgi:hypothetical protein